VSSRTQVRLQVPDGRTGLGIGDEEGEKRRRTGSKFFQTQRKSQALQNLIGSFWPEGGRFHALSERGCDEQLLEELRGGAQRRKVRINHVFPKARECYPQAEFPRVLTHGMDMLEEFKIATDDKNVQFALMDRLKGVRLASIMCLKSETEECRCAR
jgi:hypothetical protein